MCQVRRWGVHQDIIGELIISVTVLLSHWEQIQFYSLKFYWSEAVPTFWSEKLVC